MTRPPDLTRFVERLRHPPAGPFQTGRPVHVARAPGRLDVMGGIADYSGSLVLQLPIAESAIVAAQASDRPGVTVVSRPAEGNQDAREWSASGSAWQALAGADVETVARLLASGAARRWPACVVGPIVVLLKEMAVAPPVGLRILVESAVPEGKGVGSSAEVATMRAAASLLGLDLGGTAMARLCQVAENRIARAPCGIMDQMTASLGRAHHLLALLCQPDRVEGFAPLPEGVRCWGIDSGVRHAVSGSDYRSVRVGAFMGYRIIAAAAGLVAHAPDERGVVEVEDGRWGGYLANVTPAELERDFAGTLPAEIGGREFLERWGGLTDPVTRVDPDRTYTVIAPTGHPVYEHQRVRRFRDLVTRNPTDAALAEMGRLMLESHASYSACGLGSAETDLMVELVRRAGAGSGLFGAGVTGGGSGGTVAVLGRVDAEPVIDTIAREFAGRTGGGGQVFRGSSPGAEAAPVLSLRP